MHQLSMLDDVLIIMVVLVALMIVCVVIYLVVPAFHTGSESDAWTRGYTDGCNGVETCPYEATSKEAKAWRTGQSDAFFNTHPFG